VAVELTASAKRRLAKAVREGKIKDRSSGGGAKGKTKREITSRAAKNEKSRNKASSALDKALGITRR